MLSGRFATLISLFLALLVDAVTVAVADRNRPNTDPLALFGAVRLDVVTLAATDWPAPDTRALHSTLEARGSTAADTVPIRTLTGIRGELARTWMSGTPSDRNQPSRPNHGNYQRSGSSCRCDRPMCPIGASSIAKIYVHSFQRNVPITSSRS